MPDTCEWLDDRCDRPSAGQGPHPIHGVVHICRLHAGEFGVPLISTTSKDQ